MPQKALKLFRRALKIVQGSSIARSFSIETEIMFYISLMHDKMKPREREAANVSNKQTIPFALYPRKQRPTS